MKKKQEEEIQQNISDNGHDLEGNAKLDQILAGLGDDLDKLTAVELDDHVDVEQKLGVLQRLVTAVLDDKAYRQAVLTAHFSNETEAKLCSDAISERKRYGASIAPIVDRVIAQCAVNGRRATQMTEAINSYTLKTNQFQPKWKKDSDTKGIRG